MRASNVKQECKAYKKLQLQLFLFIFKTRYNFSHTHAHVHIPKVSLRSSKTDSVTEVS